MSKGSPDNVGKRRELQVEEAKRGYAGKSIDRHTGKHCQVAGEGLRGSWGQNG